MGETISLGPVRGTESKLYHERSEGPVDRVHCQQRDPRFAQEDNQVYVARSHGDTTLALEHR